MRLSAAILKEGFELGSSPEYPASTLVSLFTGAGGLDIGLEAAGFSSCVCIENDPIAREAIQRNKPAWRLATPGDVHAVKPQQILKQSGLASGNVDLIAGGPPCQPFSKSAYWVNRGIRGLQDPRAQTLTAYIDIVKHLRPKTILLENVRDLVAAGGGVGGIELLQSSFNEINQTCGTNYRLQVIHVNAADYGVPQIRHRVFIFASVDGRHIALPPPTHGPDKEYPYTTAWDAIGDLDVEDWPEELRVTGKWADLLPSIPEGQNYLWHTPRGKGEPLFGWRTRYWSFLLKLSKRQPSWTIQAAPGPATGPFHWRNRKLSIRELARLQTFPDSYDFGADHRAAQRVIGNAVPCAVGELIGRTIRRQIFEYSRISPYPSLIPSKRNDCPRAHPRRPVPQQYLALRGDYLDHPGVGRGPGRRWLR